MQAWKFRKVNFSNSPIIPFSPYFETIKGLFSSALSPLLGDIATTFCSKIGNVFEMLSKYICTCGSAIHILSFSNRCPYLCELPILSRNLRLSRYPIGIVDSSKPWFLAIVSNTDAYLNHAVLLLWCGRLYSLEYQIFVQLFYAHVFQKYHLLILHSILDPFAWKLWLSPCQERVPPYLNS